MAKIMATTEIRRAPRGRKANLDADLLAIFASLEPGQMVLLDEEFDPCGDDKTLRQRVGSTIRNHFKAARSDFAVPSVNFTPEGVAQVSIHEAKTDAKRTEHGWKAPAKSGAKPVKSSGAKS